MEAALAGPSRRLDLSRALRNPLFGGDELIYAVHQLTVEEIKALRQAYAEAAKRALAAGHKRLEMDYAHGYLGASFFSPLTNQRTNQYGLSVAHRARFRLEALDAVRAVWLEKYPLAMQLGSDDLSCGRDRYDERAWPEPHRPFAPLQQRRDDRSVDDEVGVMIKRAHRVLTEVSNPVAASWSLGIPQNAVREAARS